MPSEVKGWGRICGEGPLDLSRIVKVGRSGDTLSLWLGCRKCSPWRLHRIAIIIWRRHCGRWWSCCIHLMIVLWLLNLWIIHSLHVHSITFFTKTVGWTVCLTCIEQIKLKITILLFFRKLKRKRCDYLLGDTHIQDCKLGTCICRIHEKF